MIKVPEGVVVIEQERSPNQPPQIKRFTVLEDDSELSGEDIKDPEANTDPNTNAPLVSMKFSDKGREAFARVTKRIAERGFNASTLQAGGDKDQFNQRFAITLDDQIVSLATIDFTELPEGIDGRDGAQIENVGSFQDANDLAESLRIGALPIDLKLISETQVSATLGKQALDQGLLAGAVGLALTIVFLLFFYRVLGLVATAALLIYALLLFALVKLIPITLTLPGIAGLVLTLAVAADANIVMYERIKEEVRAGRSIPAAISAGYAKALRTIIDANVVTVGVAFILFTLATAGVKGFAFTLGIGTLVSLFTAVLATSAILGSMARSRLLRRPSALGVGKDHKSWSFDFMGNSRWFFSFSGVILLIGAISIATLGINFGIDFESGTRIVTPLERQASVDDVRSTLEPLGYADAKIQQVDDPELGENVFQLRVPQLDPNQVGEVEAALDEDYGVAGDQFSSQSIGPTFGQQIARTALLAVIASLLLISLYIGFRFEWKFAVPILIALAHDLLITGGVYALTEREVTTSTVAALLTIMGYSLYDTVIVFDRIRENVPRMPRATFSQIANRSMSEVFTRSLATSFVVLMPVGALLLFGGDTLKDFAFALLVGVASGTYSSIFIATPVVVEWKEREQVYMRRRRMRHGAARRPRARVRHRRARRRAGRGRRGRRRRGRCRGRRAAALARQPCRSPCRPPARGAASGHRSAAARRRLRPPRHPLPPPQPVEAGTTEADKGAPPPEVKKPPPEVKKPPPEVKKPPTEVKQPPPAEVKKPPTEVKKPPPAPPAPASTRPRPATVRATETATAPRSPRARLRRGRAASPSASVLERSTVADEPRRLDHDGHRSLALHGVPAGPLLGRDRGRLPGVGDRRSAVRLPRQRRNRAGGERHRHPAGAGGDPRCADRARALVLVGRSGRSRERHRPRFHARGLALAGRHSGISAGASPPVPSASAPRMGRMQSRSTRWESQPYDVAVAGRLAGELGVSRIVGAILARRGFADSEDARRFLAAEQRHDPLGLPGVAGRLRADPRPPAPGLADRGVRRLRRRRRLLDRHARPRPARARGRPGLGAAEPLRRGLRPLGRRRQAAYRPRHRAAGHGRLRYHRRRARSRRPRRRAWTWSSQTITAPAPSCPTAWSCIPRSVPTAARSCARREWCSSSRRRCTEPPVATRAPPARTSTSPRSPPSAISCRCVTRTGASPGRASWRSRARASRASARSWPWPAWSWGS